jgi:hypothetical protein
MGHDLQPPQVADSLVLKKLRETLSHLRYSAVKMCNVSKLVIHLVPEIALK